MIKVAVFSTLPYDEHFLSEANAVYGHSLDFLEPRLTKQTVSLASGFDAVCVFVNVHAGMIDVLARAAAATAGPVWPFRRLWACLVRLLRDRQRHPTYFL